ncbi:MAG: homoserine O-succinyltransferase [Firmicutes bacterium]|jgi:homoserine O-succinyltransferase|nr:homoserine O-succinyltransferase [Bacillota bacterium]
MPVLVKETLPAYKTLKGEGIFIMGEKRATSQDIRPLEILLLNLMPLKEVTETQLIRYISNSIIQVNITFLKIKDHVSKNTSPLHLNEFYTDIDSIKKKKYDGLIITGAPVEQMDFSQVSYWEEYKEILEYAEKNITSTIHICWAAMASLYHKYGHDKVEYEKKLFGVFKHSIIKENEPLLTGIDEEFLVPHSRHSGIDESAIINNKSLKVLANSESAGSYLIVEEGYKNIYITGHSEYDYNTLDIEYKRDLKEGKSIEMPQNYYPDDNADLKPLNRWRSSGNTLFNNWLNYCVYQITDYEL